MIPVIWFVASLPDKSCMKATISNQSRAVHTPDDPMRRKGQPGNANLPIGGFSRRHSGEGRPRAGDNTREKKSLYRLVFRVAESFQIAFGAFRLARLADFAPVPDQLVGKQNPFFPRNYLHQVLLDLL